jgi:hypothetical protein
LKIKICIYQSEDVFSILQSIRELKEELHKDGIKKYDRRIWFIHESVRTNCTEQEIDVDEEEE